MKKVALILFSLIAYSAFSQQTAQYSQYSFNNFGLNPAFLGTARCVDFRTGYRQQWVGIDGAPKTTFASFQAPLKRSPYKKGKHSVGLYLELDAIHKIKRTVIKGAYSYHKKLSLKYTLGGGIFIGIQQYHNDITIDETNPDPVLVAAAGKVIRYPDIMPGILLYSNRIYWSFAINQLYFKSINLGEEAKQINQYYFGAGHKTLFKSDWTFFQSFLLKMNVLAPPSIDLNVAWVYEDKLTLGLGYRVGESAIAQVKFNFGKIKVGYAFDYPINKLMGNYSHEIVIGLSQCGGGDVGNGRGLLPHVCPAYN